MIDDLDSRTKKLEQQIRDFRIVNPSGQVKGGFGPLKQGTDLEQRVKNVEESFRTFRLMGGEGVKVSGGVKFGGYVIEAKGAAADSGTGTGTMTPISGCTDPGATNFNPFATVDDGSCIFEETTGACCVDADCSITSEADCEGVYQGDDTVCDPNPCACPEVTLDCDQVCFGGQRCGWPGFFNTGFASDTYWQTAESSTETSYDNRNEVGNGAVCEAFADTTIVGNFPLIPLASFCDPSDATETACSGTSTCQCYNNFEGEDGELQFTTVCDFCADTCDNFDCVGSANINPAYTFRFGTPSSDTVASFSTGETVFTDTSGSTVLSDEITLAAFNTYLNDNLPAYDDDYNDDCEAKRFDEHFGDASRFTVCHFKPRFSFTSAPVNFTIHYNEHFEPQPDYGTGSPFDTPRSVDVLMGDTEVFGDEVLTPSDTGTTTITDIVVDCTLA